MRDNDGDLKYVSINELATLLGSEDINFLFGNYSEFVKGAITVDGYAIALAYKNTYNLIVAQRSDYGYDYYDDDYECYTNPFTVHVDYGDGVETQKLEFQTKEDCLKMLIDFGRKNKINLNKTECKAKSNCKDYNELVLFANKHGYKEGWAYHTAKKLG